MVYVRPRVKLGVSAFSSIFTVALAVIAAIMAGGGVSSSLLPLVAAVGLTGAMYLVSLAFTRGSLSRIMEVVGSASPYTVAFNGHVRVTRGRLAASRSSLAGARIEFRAEGEAVQTTRLDLEPSPYTIAYSGERVSVLDLPAYLVEAGDTRFIVAYAYPPRCRVEPQGFTIQLGEVSAVLELDSCDDGGLQGHVSLAPDTGQQVKLTASMEGVKITLYSGRGSGSFDYRPLREPLVIIGPEKLVKQPSTLTASLPWKSLISGSGNILLELRLGGPLRSSWWAGQVRVRLG